ncbi:MAG: dipeptidase [Bacteroidetes bacterium]|nr:dipeptidase [Bacteroidota bacterium]
MDPVLSPSTYLQENKARFLDELIALLRMPSVSANPAHAGDVRNTALWIKTHLEQLGADRVELVETGGHPLVYAEKIVDPALPTVLVYGHYDVQPPDPLELWNSPPFEPVVKDEKLYARGACDDKGQMFLHLKAFELMQQAGPLPVNLKFMIEGEEEVGSVNLEAFLRKYREQLKADVVLVSDTSMLANDAPSITTGLRGLSYLEVEVTGPNRDLHSGVYGGAVRNPINALSHMIASLQDDQGRITIPGFYNDVATVSEDERSAMARAPFDLKAYKAHLAIEDVAGEAGYSTLERTTIRPTLDVNGIWGGYTGEGAKTVLPSKAYAKISMRLVPNQKPEVITALFTEHFKSLAPAGTKVVVTPHHGGDPAVTPTDNPAYRAAARAMEATFGKTPIPLRSGGSIPIVALFEQILGLKTILLGFGLDSDAIHSPNEHFGLFNFYKGIETVPLFHQFFAEEMRNG